MTFMDITSMPTHQRQVKKVVARRVWTIHDASVSAGIQRPENVIIRRGLHLVLFPEMVWYAVTSRVEAGKDLKKIQTSSRMIIVTSMGTI